MGQGQSVVETVDFNSYVSATDNDLANRFLIGRAAAPGLFTQVATGGITGGAVVPPSVANYNLDYYNYCSTYANPVGGLTETSLCFKYNATLVNPNAVVQPVKINFESDAVNHYLICQLRRYVNYQPGVFELSYTTYGANGQTIMAALVTGHWYKFVVQHRSDGGQFNDQVYAKLELFDIGTTGTGTPVSVGSRTVTFTDALWVASTRHTIDIAASRQGGAELLDNFSFNGPKAGSLCTVASSTGQQQLNANLAIYPNPAKGRVTLQFGPGFKQKVARVELLDMMGKTIDAAPAMAADNRLVLDVASVAAGAYVVRVSTDHGNYLRKLTLE
ncbi:hypothetical protein GCM10028824_28000 [Hymenobacter segetis]